MAARRVDPWVAAVVLAVLGVAAAWLGTEWALSSADGAVVLVDGSTDHYQLEFIDRSIYWTAALAGVIAVGLSALYRWQAAAAGLVAVVAGLVWGAAVCVQRYRDSGWGDGLTLVVYVVPILTAVVGSAVVAFLAVRPRSPRG